MSAINDEDSIHLDPNQFFKSFQDPNSAEGELRVDAIVMNLCYLLQSDKTRKWTREAFVEYLGAVWDHIEPVEKISIYQ